VVSECVKGVPQFVKMPIIPVMQIVSNYLSNAVKYSLDGGTITINTSFHPSLCELEIIVSDEVLALLSLVETTQLKLIIIIAPFCRGWD
jgi:signal transduction histidine kinase